MKTTKKADGLYVDEPCIAQDVVFAGLEGLTLYYGLQQRSSVYSMKAFAICEAYTSMLRDIEARDGIEAYNDAILYVMDRIRAAREESGGNGRGEETQAPPQG